MRVAMRILTLGLMITLAASARADVSYAGPDTITLHMVPVGNAGNVADPATGSLYGAVRL